MPQDRINRAAARHFALLCAESYQRAPEFLDYNVVESVSHGTDDATVFWRPGRLVVAFRGTERAIEEWLMNLAFCPVPWHQLDPKVYVHRGFLANFYDLWRMIRATDAYDRLERVDEIIYTGHSRGGALAQLAALRTKPDLVCTFGAPRVGGRSFRRACAQAGIRHWRIVNLLDSVPHRPSFWFRHFGQRFLASLTGTHDIHEYIEALS